jgi:hypothetical protein
MNDPPSPAQLLAAVAAFLRDDALPALQGATAYQARVAASMLDIARRQLELAPAQQADEWARLRALLGAEGDLAALNRRLAERIAAGEMTLDTPGLVDHLWRVTLAKLAVDQPGYDTYRRMPPGPPEER